MTEYEEQLIISEYISINYPNVIFFTDGSAGIKLRIGQAVKLKNLKSSRGLPDLFILESKNSYHGLIIELKRTGEKLYKKDGVTFKTEHLQEQSEILERLEYKGYYACFALGFDAAISTINDYMNERL